MSSTNPTARSRRETGAARARAGEDAAGPSAEERPARDRGRGAGRGAHPVPWWRDTTTTGITTMLIVAAMTVLVANQLHFPLWFTDTTPTGGDLGGHVWGPAFLRDHLLANGRLAGWAPDWYAGFPAYRFYMVLPSLAIVALDLVLPYNVAFKLIVVSGLVTLPALTAHLGRSARIPFPGPPLFAVAATAFLFNRSFTIYGGNIASTMAGEFSFSVSLAAAVALLAVIYRGLDTGTHQRRAAVLFAVCALSHVIVALFALTAAIIVVATSKGAFRSLRPWRWAVPAAIVGAALTSFWSVPFLARRAYLNDMGWERYTNRLEALFPGRLGIEATRALGGGAGADITGDMTWVIVAAFVGAALSLWHARRAGIAIIGIAAAAATGFTLLPQGRLWNARLLPFWYLALYLLAALAAVEVTRIVARAVTARFGSRAGTGASVAGGVAAAAVAFVAIAAPLHAVPGGTVHDDGSFSVAWHTAPEKNSAAGWAEWDLSGYEAKPGWGELDELAKTMARIGSERGCGRAMWEYSTSFTNDYGTTMAPMLLPYWTDGCIGSMEGLYFEASTTTPFHFLNQSMLSANPSRAQRDLPYPDVDVDLGADSLGIFGVRYYLANTPTMKAFADSEPRFTYLEESGQWSIYEVEGSELVEGLTGEPVVVDDMTGHDWLEPAVTWYLDPSRRDVAFTDGGPASWRRATSTERPEPEPIDPVQVTNIEAGTDTVSFQVDEIGKPVVVKMSYFPNWEARGADGPWRITPNLMVVVPTDTAVEMHYTSTPVEWSAWALTAAGMAGLALLGGTGAAVTARLRRRAVEPERGPDRSR